jgi:hypothetical protein
MQPSGVDSAIQELERDVKRVQEVIGMLRNIRSERLAKSNGNGRNPGRLSAAGRRRISLAAKKRWAAVRAAKK